MKEFTPVLAAHAIVALTALLLGPVQILRRRRDRAHRYLGRAWVAAMALTCLSSFLVHDHGFTWLHGLSLFTLASITNGVVQVRRGNLRGHIGSMAGSYAGTVIAFAFAALVPTRVIRSTLEHDPAGVLVWTAVVAAACGIGVAAVLLRHGRSRGRGSRLDAAGRPA